MKVSIITAVLNRASMIADCISSVGEQTHPDVEHIVVDGGSTDGTLDVIRNHRHQVAVLVCDPDEGIYYALNKGIVPATGEVVGILGADDVYASQHVIETVVRVLNGTGTDSCYGDLL